MDKKLVNYDLVIKAAITVNDIKDGTIMDDYVYNQTYLLLVYSFLNIFKVKYEVEYNEDKSIKTLRIIPDVGTNQD